MSRAPNITVVGSINVDIGTQVRALPRPGETVHASSRWVLPGGKGANQAVAAARLGRRVSFVGAVGGDDAGAMALNALRDAAVDVQAVETVSAPTGQAFVVVEPGGENLIVLDAGANEFVTESQVRAAPAVRSAALVLLQLEIPVATVEAAAACATGVVVLNPAPAPAQTLPELLLERVDVLVPNRTELARLVGADEPQTLSEVADLARSAASRSDVVVTLGAEGALVVRAGGGATHVPARPTDVIDTTGAGDAFCGALADAMVSGADPVAAAEWATACASLSVKRRGAQAGMPTITELAALGLHVGVR